MGDSVGRRVPMRHSLNSRRSMLLYGFLGILCLVRTIESGPLTESNESRGGTLQSKKSQDEEVGNPSEIAYQAWLLIDGHPDSQPLGGLDSASLLRRIKPKSIFVAPNLTACPEGYQDDTMNRCVKDVNIDHQAHKGFLVQRLQAIFGHKSQAAASSSSSASASSSPSLPNGPLQLNIPLIMTAPRETINFQPQKPEEATKSTTDASKIILDEGKGTNLENIENEEKQEATIVTVYELNEEESTFFLGNKSSGNTVENNKNREPTILVPPVADDAPNDGNGDSPSVHHDLSSIDNSNDKGHNLTILVGGSIDKHNEGTYEDTPSRVKDDNDNDKKTKIAPTVVLVVSSPTKVPVIPLESSDLIVAHNSSLGQVVIEMSNVTTSNATKEIIRVSVPDAIASSNFPDDINGDSAEASTTESRVTIAHNNTTHGKDEEPTESSEIYDTYDEENYEDSSEMEDEILKHSEAGITVTLPAPGQRVTDNSATTYNGDDKEAVAAGSSEISGEVSINRDFVRETTLVDFNISKTVNSTILPSVIVQPDKPETLVAENIRPPTDDSTAIGKPDDDVDDGGDVSIVEMKKSPLSGEMSGRRNESEVQRVVFPGRSNEEETVRNKEPTWTEKSESTETMIASSTNDAHQIVVSREQAKFDMPSYSSSKKRAGQPFSFGATTTTKIPPNPISTTANLERVHYPPRSPYDLPEDPRVPLPMDKRRYPDSRDTRYENFFPSHHRDYVSFDDSHAQPNYVSFPPQEANSIHPNDYKERRPYNRYQQQLDYGRGSPVTKNPSTQDIHRKESYWWLPPGWPINKHHHQQHQQQQQQQQQDIQRRSGNDRSRTPMLLRFWTRMPLVRDPSINYQHPTYPTPGNRTFASPRRVNYYKEISSRDLNTAFARKTLPSAIGG